MLRPYAPGLVAVVMLQAVGAVAGLVPLLAVAELGRTLLREGPTDPDRVLGIVVVAAIGLAVRVAFTGASSAVGHVLDTEVQLALRRALARHMARVPMGWLARQRTGELVKVVGDDVSAVHPFIAHTPGILVSAFLVPVVSLGYLLTVDWRLTLVTLVPVVLALALLPLLMTPTRLREQEDYDAGTGRIASSALEFVQGIAVVKAFGGGHRAHRRFVTDVEDFVGAFTRMVRGLAGPAAGMELVLSPPFVLLAVLVGGAARIGAGLPPGDALPFLLLGPGLTAPVAALANHGLEDLQSAQRAVGRIRDLLDVPAAPEPSTPVEPVGHRVELEGVRFGYAADREVLRGVDLVLEPGTFTALVGRSGSGKSTLAQLLPRFVDPSEGTVRLGGVDVREVRSSDLHRRISFVFQDVRLLRASITDNITVAAPDADREAVCRAARLAGIHDRVLALPRGYDTVLGEEATLSGGEAQRLSLAQALLDDAPVLVLDEATAFADPVTERAVARALDHLRGSRTILVIAHRLETILGADSVVMIEDGVVAESGAPHELLACDGRFAALWRTHRAVTEDVPPMPAELYGVDPR